MNLVPRKFFIDDFFDDFEPTFKNGMMRCDVYEQNDSYVFELDIPGYSKEDIKIECDKGYLTITAEHSKEVEEDTNRNYLRKERVYGKNVRQFYIGEVDENAITALFKDGILKVVVPKKEVINTKKTIEIE